MSIALRVSTRHYLWGAALLNTLLFLTISWLQEKQIVWEIYLVFALPWMLILKTLVVELSIRFILPIDSKSTFKGSIKGSRAQACYVTAVFAALLFTILNIYETRALDLIPVLYHRAEPADIPLLITSVLGGGLVYWICFTTLSKRKPGRWPGKKPR